jgi:hypothetical protein
MSRRRASGRESGPAGGSEGGPAGKSESERAGRSDSERGRRVPLGFPAQVVVLAAAFGVGVGVAEAAGAANLGTAFGIGQIVFAITLVFLLLRA